MRSVDVAVVGNGVLALSIALETARRAPELKVAVVGPPARDGAATAAAGAMLNCFGEVTQYTHAHPAGVAKFAIARQALDEWPAWLAELAADAGGAGAEALNSHLPGTHVLLTERSGEIGAANFAAMRAALRQHREPHELLGEREAGALAPRAGGLGLQVLHLRREGAVDARAVLVALEAAGRAHGVEIVPSSVRAILTSAGAASGVRTDDGATLGADTVVLAAGSASGELLAGVLPPGAAPPMLHGTGSALLTERAQPDGSPCVLRTPNRAGSCGVHLVSRPDLRRQYVGATNVITRQRAAGPGLAATESLMRMAHQELDPRIAFSSLRRWLWGARPVPLDSFPLIGRSSVGGLIVATGTYRDGFHCSPVIARHVVDDLLGVGAPDERFGWFRPERAPIETMTVEQSVAEVGAHGVETAFEQGLKLPYYLDREVLASALRAAAQRLYQRLDDPVALAPEVVLFAFISELAHDGEQSPADWLADYVRAARAAHPAPSASAVAVRASKTPA